MLTERQSQALAFIVAYQREHGGVSPNLRQIAAGIKSKSKGHVHSLLQGLERRGFITRLYNRQQAIDVVRVAPSGARVALFKFDDEIKELVPFKPATHAEILKTGAK